MANLMMMRHDGGLPNEFARLEYVDGGGVLVRFVEPVKRKVKHFLGGCLPNDSTESAESWKGRSKKTEHEILVPKAVAVFCDTPEKLVAAVKRAKESYEVMKKHDGGDDGLVSGIGGMDMGDDYGGGQA